MSSPRGSGSRPRRACGGGHPGRRQQRPAPAFPASRISSSRRRAARRSPTATAASSPTTTPPSARRSSATTTPMSTQPSAAAGRSVDLMGIGVTRVEVELAERLVADVPSLEKVLLTCTGSEATFHALRRRAHGDRPPPRDQVPGLLPRLARLGGDERDLARRAGRQQGPALGRDAARGRRRDDRLPVQRRRLPSSARSTSTTATSPRSSSSRSRTTSARCCRSPGSSSGCASSRRSTAPCSSSTR